MFSFRALALKLNIPDLWSLMLRSSWLHEDAPKVEHPALMLDAPEQLASWSRMLLLWSQISSYIWLSFWSFFILTTTSKTHLCLLGHVQWPVEPLCSVKPCQCQTWCTRLPLLRSSHVLGCPQYCQPYTNCSKYTLVSLSKSFGAVYSNKPTSLLKWALAGIMQVYLQCSQVGHL